MTGDASPPARSSAWGRRAGPLVVVTRDEDADGPMTTALEALGAHVLRLPTVAFEPVSDSESIRAALSSPDGYDWIVFTSPRAVDAVCARPEWKTIRSVLEADSDDSDDSAHSAHSTKASRGIDDRGLAALACRVAASGRTTADRLASHGIRHVLVPDEAGAAGLVQRLASVLDPSGRPRILWPRSDLADLVLADGLRAAGAEVVAPIVYRTLITAPNAGDFLRLLQENGVAAITFLSPSSARGLAAAIGGASLSSLAGRTIVASIGPTTSAALAALGAPADVESAARTAADLAEAVMAALAARGRGASGGGGAARPTSCEDEKEQR